MSLKSICLVLAITALTACASIIRDDTRYAALEVPLDGEYTDMADCIASEFRGTSFWTRDPYYVAIDSLSLAQVINRSTQSDFRFIVDLYRLDAQKSLMVLNAHFSNLTDKPYWPQDLVIDALEVCSPGSSNTIRLIEKPGTTSADIAKKNGIEHSTSTGYDYDKLLEESREAKLTINEALEKKYRIRPSDPNHQMLEAAFSGALGKVDTYFSPKPLTSLSAFYPKDQLILPTQWSFGYSGREFLQDAENRKFFAVCAPYAQSRGLLQKDLVTDDYLLMLFYQTELTDVVVIEPQHPWATHCQK